METSPTPIKTAMVPGAVIEYSERGQGEPLLLVHAGVFADWFVPLEASQTLEGVRVIRVRRAGYGNTAPTSHLTLRDHATHLTALADSLKLGAVHVLGHSSGALIALQMAADRPELVRSLMLIEPAACGPLQVPAFAALGAQFIGPAMGAFAAGDLQGAFDAFMQGVCGSDSREVVERRLGPSGYAQAIRESQFFFRDEVPACMEWEFGAAGTIRTPLLVLEGADGRKTGELSQQVTERVASLFPHAEVALIDGTNHLLPLQDPDGLGQAVADFIRRHPIGSQLPPRDMPLGVQPS